MLNNPQYKKLLSYILQNIQYIYHTQCSEVELAGHVRIGTDILTHKVPIANRSDIAHAKRTIRVNIAQQYHQFLQKALFGH